MKEIVINQNWEEEIDPVTAGEDAARFIESRDFSPNRKKEIEPLIKVLIEAIQFGYVIVNDDDSITQKFRKPICNSDGKAVLENLKYEARVKTGAINDAMQKLQPHTAVAQIVTYASIHTGKPIEIINKVNSGYDRTVLESISTLFF